MASVSDYLQESMDELDGARDYLHKAMEEKTYNRNLADELCNVASQEMQHADVMASIAQRKIVDMEDGLAKAELLKMWSAIQERNARRIAENKELMAMVKR